MNTSRRLVPAHCEINVDCCRFQGFVVAAFVVKFVNTVTVVVVLVAVIFILSVASYPRLVIPHPYSYTHIHDLVVFNAPAFLSLAVASLF